MIIVDDTNKKLLEEKGIIVDNFNDVDALLEKINDKSYSTDLNDPLVKAYLTILKDNKQDGHYLRRILKYHQIYELDDNIDDKKYSTKEIEDFIKEYTSIMWEEDVYYYNKEFVKALYDSSIDISKELIDAHKYSFNNKKYLKDDGAGICYNCNEGVRVEDIIDYIDDGKTAICPYCNAPTLLPIRVKRARNRVFLEEMLKRWYQDTNGKFIDGVAAYDNFYLPSANFSFKKDAIVRGYNSFYRNKIKSLDVRVNKYLTRVLSSVEDGNNLYEVDIRIKNDVVKFMRCTCPVNDNCQHEYNSLMAYLRDYYSYRSEVVELKEIINWLNKKDIVVTFTNDNYIMGEDSKFKDLFELILSSTIAIYSKAGLDEELKKKRIAEYTLEEVVTYLTNIINKYRTDKSIMKKHIDDGTLLEALKKLLKYLQDKAKSAESLEVL